MAVFNFNEDQKKRRKKKRAACNSLYTAAEKAYVARATHCLVSLSITL